MFGFEVADSLSPQEQIDLLFELGEMLNSWGFFLLYWFVVFWVGTFF